MVTVPLGFPPRIEPWNWAPPLISAVVAFGKFHISRGRRSVVGSPARPLPVLVFTVGVVPVMLTSTVAPAGIR